jgi:hypothetical protein
MHSLIPLCYKTNEVRFCISTEEMYSRMTFTATSVGSCRLPTSTSQNVHEWTDKIRYNSLIMYNGQYQYNTIEERRRLLSRHRTIIFLNLQLQKKRLKSKVKVSVI